MLWERFGDLAVVTIRNPPVNAGSHAVRLALLEALRSIAERGDVDGAILVGEGDNFMAGSDIREFGRPLRDPQLPAVIAAIEALRVPVAAAIRGAALGGGYELALGCDLRIADATATVGLPEVGLGLVPGAGGTQRLPRLTGVPAAIDLVLSGRRVSAREALSLGMIDRIGEGDLLRDAAVALRALNGVKRPVAARAVPPFTEAKALEAGERALARTRHRPAAKEALRLILDSGRRPFDTALADERTTFQAIRVSPEAFAHRHLFFAERNAARAPDGGGAPVRRAAVIGAGTMGAAIAYTLAVHGVETALVDMDGSALAQARIRIASFQEQARRRRGTSEPDAPLPRIEVSTSLDCVRDVDLAVEAVFEDIGAKREVIGRLGQILSPNALIATNTSYLDIASMALDLPRPERFLGLHFFAPAHVMKLLEIVRSPDTDDATLARALALARRIGKQPVVARNAPGFIGNRIYAAYRRHAEYLLHDGAAPEAVDRALTEFGMALGPFATADLSGLDIAWRMRQAKAATRDPAQRYVDVADRLCEAGRLGRKTGSGYYDHQDGTARPASVVSAIIDASRRDAGLRARPVGDEEIVTRCLGAIVNEAARLFAEGVARRAGDIDVVLVHGYGFPRWTGGPVWWFAGLSEARQGETLAAAAAAEGAGFRAGDVDALLRDILASPATNNP